MAKKQKSTYTKKHIQNPCVRVELYRFEADSTHFKWIYYLLLAMGAKYGTNSVDYTVFDGSTGQTVQLDKAKLECIRIKYRQIRASLGWCRTRRKKFAFRIVSICIVFGYLHYPYIYSTYSNFCWFKLSSWTVCPVEPSNTVTTLFFTYCITYCTSIPTVTYPSELLLDFSVSDPVFFARSWVMRITEY